MAIIISPDAEFNKSRLFNESNKMIYYQFGMEIENSLSTQQ